MDKDKGSYYIINDGAADDKYKYAGFWVRFAAMGIDLIILIFIYNIYNGVLLSLFPSFVLNPDNTELVNRTIEIISWLLGTFYFVYFTYKFNRTIGKKIFGIKVISDRSENTTLKQIFIREIIGKWFSAFIFYIGFIAAGFDPRKQAFHDKIAGTLVVFKK